LKPLRSQVLKTFKGQKLSRDHAEYVEKNTIKIHLTVWRGIDYIRTGTNSFFYIKIEYIGT